MPTTIYTGPGRVEHQANWFDATARNFLACTTPAATNIEWQ